MCAEINTVQCLQKLPETTHNSAPLVKQRSTGAQICWPGSFLTTSAISSIPFLDVTNSLLGRMDFRTAWGGRFELGASMSPIVMKRKTLLELRAAQTTSTAAILVQNKHTHTHTQMRYEEAWGFSEVEAETMTSSEMQRERQKKRSATSAFSRCEMRCPQLHTTAEIYNSWCHKEKNLYWYFFFSFPLQFRNLKQPHHA